MGKEEKPELVLIDDEEGMRETLGDIFREANYKVDAFADGKKAIAFLRKNTSNVVIADILLPEISGIQILEQAKEIDSDMAVILMTGNASLETAIEAMNKGAYAYILKPINPDELKIIVKKALREIELRQKNKELIDELQMTNRNLTTANQKLSSLTQEMEDFLHVVSHDLKGPLINIHGFSSKLMESYQDFLGDLERIAIGDSKALAVFTGFKEDFKKNAGSYLGFIQKSVKRMDVLISSLLALSRVGRLAEEKEIVDVGALVDEVAAIFSYQFKENKIKFLKDPLPYVKGNRNDLIQVFSNLIGNAIHYMGDERKAREIRVGYRELPEHLEFYVRDTGIGIEEKDIEKVFKPFVRLNEIAREGEGIGLSIVRKIIRCHGGQVRVNSRKGEGSVFYFTLPKEVQGG